MLRKSVGQVSQAAGRRAFSTTEAKAINIKATDGVGAVSRLSLVVDAGSRYHSVPGTAHILEKFAFRDTAKRSALRLTREAELLGGRFGTSLGREKLILSTSFLREDLPYFVEALANVAKGTQFKGYEYDEFVLPLAKAEAQVAAQDSVAVAIDAAHTAAFRTGLGNSRLLSADSEVSLDSVRAYANTVYNKNNVTLVGQAVSVQDLQQFAGEQFADLQDGEAAASSPTSFHSGEVRIPSGASEQAVVLAFAGQPSPALTALVPALSSKAIKWSTGTGLLDAIAAKHNVTIDVANNSYSDAALFTVAISGADALAIKAATLDTAEVLKKLASSVDEATAKRAIARAKFEYAAAVDSANAAGVDVSDVSKSSLQEAAKALFGGKASLAVVGQTYRLPYLDELF